METSLTPSNIAALAGIMLLGAAVPSVSVLAVSARSAALGFAHGALTSAGIVVGDMIFIVIAIYGLSALASLLGDHFVLIQYLGGVYLIGLGIVLWAAKPKAEGAKQRSAMSSSFLTGLLITLATRKRSCSISGSCPRS